MNNSVACGVDIGGSHITVSLVDVGAGKPVIGSQTRMDLNSEDGSEAIINTCAEAILKTLQNNSHPDIPIGIAMPGPFDYENGICLIKEQKKFISLYKLPLKNLIAERLDKDPSLIYFMNDACGFLEGEMLGGALKGQKDVMGITMGTGLGSSYNRNGETVDASLWNQRFKDGIAEDYISTRWFISRFEQLTSRKVRGVREIADTYKDDPSSAVLFKEFADNLGDFISSQYNNYPYSNIVLGGNIAKASKLFMPACSSYLNDCAPGARVCIAELNEDAPLIGSAGMAYRKYNALKEDKLQHVIDQ